MQSSFPTKFQFFGSRDDCQSANKTSWMALSPMILYTSPETLHVTTVQRKQITCLKLTIFEMDNGGKVALGGLMGEHLKLLKQITDATNDWRGKTVAQEASLVCPLYVSQPICNGRVENRWYDLESSLSSCQCDALCSQFGDCCRDYFKTDSVGDDDKNGLTLEDKNIECVSTYGSRAGLKNLAGIGFYLITSCSKSFRDDTVRSKCLFPQSGNKVGNPIFRLPVEINGMPYKNVYCALCNFENVSEEQFWRLKIVNGEPCQVLLQNMKRGESFDASILDDERTCHERSISHPIGNALHGRHRLGKLCLFDKSKDGKEERNKGFLLIMDYNRIETVESQCFCRHCSHFLAPFVTFDMTTIMRVIKRFSEWKFIDDEIDRSGPGYFWTLFEKSSDETNAKDSEYRPLGMLVISLTGSGVSIVCFSLIVGYLARIGVPSVAKRCQLGIAVSKLLLYVALCGGTALRHVAAACKAFALLLHFSLLASFCHVAWYGTQVSHLLWQLNHNMAALAVENRDPGMSWREVLLTIGVWIGPLGVVITLWCLQEFHGGFSIHYGSNEYCMLTGELGRLYFMAIPATILVAVSLGNLAFSVFQFINLRDQPLNKDGFYSLLKFLSRLIMYQSLQWIFGVIYYFTESTMAQFTFELFVAFDGLLMALSFFSDVLRKYFL